MRGIKEEGRELGRKVPFGNISLLILYFQPHTTLPFPLLLSSLLYKEKHSTCGKLTQAITVETKRKRRESGEEQRKGELLDEEFKTVCFHLSLSFALCLQCAAH